MNVFSLFTVDGERVCGPHSGNKDSAFKETIRPKFPGAPVPTAAPRAPHPAPAIALRAGGPAARVSPTQTTNGRRA